MTQSTEPAPSDEPTPSEVSGANGDRRRPPFALEDPMIRFDARVLDPTTAVRLPDGNPPSPTVYVGDTLLITAAGLDDAQELLSLLQEAVKASRLPLELAGRDPFENTDDPEHDRRARLLRLAAERKLPLVFPVRFRPAGDGPAAAVDVWPLLQFIRFAGRTGAGDDRAERLSKAAGLNHLMSSAAVISGSPFMRGGAVISGDPFMRGGAVVAGSPFMRGGAAGGVMSYVTAGSGGRGPVSVVLPPPLRSSKLPAPHVIVLDTGVGEHPWFDAQAVRVGLEYADPQHPGTPLRIGMDPLDAAVIASDPEAAGAIPDPMTGLLDTHAGHGTFIAGLLRQACADADITAVRVMDSDGIVPELMLTDALIGLAVVQTDHKPYIDALVMSLGYYSETGDDVTYTAGLRPLVLTLAALGVAIFCAAGNDSTQRRSYPAAFSDDPAFAGGQHLPMASVAALNPDSTVALFSNDGDWVNSEAPGANLVSTAPIRARGSWTQDTYFVAPDKSRRGTIDPDSFASGFSTWSGTSFAAPVLAGRYLARLASAAVARTVAAREPLLGLGRGA